MKEDLEISTRISLKKVKLSISGNEFRLLALDGEVIPGQCSLQIGEKDRNNRRTVRVVFEVLDADH